MRPMDTHSCHLAAATLHYMQRSALDNKTLSHHLDQASAKIVPLCSDFQLLQDVRELTHKSLIFTETQNNFVARRFLAPLNKP